MLQPVGSLPPAVYWRRRALTLVVLLAAVGLLVGLVLAVSTSGATPTASPGPASTSSTPSAPGDPFAGLQTATASGGGAVATSAASGPTPAPPAALPAPTACADKAVTVVAAIEQPSYQIGSKPDLILTVVNVGAVACIRDLDAAGQELLLYAGKTRLWSSNDCYPETTEDVRTLAPKQSVQFTVTWSGLSSEPTCTAPRTAVPAGTYQVVARQGKVRSTPVAITLTP